MSGRCLNGTNWGSVRIENKVLQFDQRGKTVFTLPLSKLVNSTLNKQDIVLELANENTKDNECCLQEIRFFVPDAEQELDEGEQGYS